eukprot:scaffold2686_cov57-Phaeocystis_antarctica.AAC.2
MTVRPRRPRCPAALQATARRGADDRRRSARRAPRRPECGTGPPPSRPMTCRYRPPATDQLAATTHRCRVADCAPR